MPSWPGGGAPSCRGQLGQGYLSGWGQGSRAPPCKRDHRDPQWEPSGGGRGGSSFCRAAVAMATGRPPPEGLFGWEPSCLSSPTFRFPDGLPGSPPHTSPRPPEGRGPRCPPQLVLSDKVCLWGRGKLWGGLEHLPPPQLSPQCLCFCGSGWEAASLSPSQNICWLILSIQSCSRGCQRLDRYQWWLQPNSDRRAERKPKSLRIHEFYSSA